MNNTKITQADLAGKGVVGMPDVPGLPVQDMQHKLDELALDVLAPKHNALIDVLAGPGGAGAIGSGSRTVADHITAQSNPHDVTAAQVGAYTKEETDVQINDRIVDIGSADMARAVYDTDGNGVVDDAQRLGGQLPAFYAAAHDAFRVYSHICEEGVHRLTGTGGNIKFTAAAPFLDGDVFEVNGDPCRAQGSDGEAVQEGLFAAGAVVSCFREDDVLNFKTGGAALGYKLIPWADINDPPAAAHENYIIADVHDVRHVLWSANPQRALNYEEGTVWIKCLSNASTRLDILRSSKQTAQYDPVALLQKQDGDWATIPARIFKNDGWVDITGEVWLMDGADLYTDITGGYTSSAPKSGTWYFNGITPNPFYLCPSGNNNGISAAVLSNLPIDLTGIRALEYTLTGIRGYGGSGYANPNNYLYVTDTAGALHTKSPVALLNDVREASHIASLSVSHLTGFYYVGLGMTQRGTASNGFQWMKLRGVY